MDRCVTETVCEISPAAFVMVAVDRAAVVVADTAAAVVVPTFSAVVDGEEEMEVEGRAKADNMSTPVGTSGHAAKERVYMCMCCTQANKTWWAKRRRTGTQQKKREVYVSLIN